MSDPFHPYAERYQTPNGPGDQRPTALEIIKDNNLLNKWQDKVVLITGGTSGIGIETARALHATGAHVFITARDLNKAKSVISNIQQSSKGSGSLDVVEIDMDSLASVKKAAKDFLSRSDKLNILINNAGIMAAPQSTTLDGHERHLGVNHLAHFTLTALLLPLLLSSSAPAFQSRVVNVSSSSHRYSSIHFDDINLSQSYDPFLAYGQSKTANIWMANYIERQYGPRGLHALSVHPGGIWSGLQRYADDDTVRAWKQDRETMKGMMTPEQGAATTVWAAVAEVWEGRGGKYLADCAVAPPADLQNLKSALDSGVGPDAYNEKGEERLWKVSCEMAGIEPV